MLGALQITATTSILSANLLVSNLSPDPFYGLLSRTTSDTNSYRLGFLNIDSETDRPIEPLLSSTLR